MASYVLFGVFAFVASIGAAACVVVVPPGHRAVYWSRFGDRSAFSDGTRSGVFILERGTHFVNAMRYSSLSVNPFRTLMGWWTYPIFGTKILVDPPNIEVRTRDGVPGMVNIAFEAVVQDWMVDDVVSQAVPFRNVAFTCANQWVSDEIGKLDTIAKQIEIERGRDLESFAALAKEQRVKNECATRLVEETNLLQIAKIKAEAVAVTKRSEADAVGARVAALIASGLDQANVARVVCAEIASTSVAKATKVFVGVSPSLIGLNLEDSKV